MTACLDCKFFQDEGLQTDGWCRRHAPRPHDMTREERIADAHDVVAVWPWVEATDWCGEWEVARKQRRRAKGMTSEAEGDATNKVMEGIFAERCRQRDQKGYLHEHDDSCNDGELVFAACAYALCTVNERIAAEVMWPWSDFGLKHKPPREMLVRAAAMIVAELERMDRKGAKG